MHSESRALSEGARGALHPAGEAEAEAEAASPTAGVDTARGGPLADAADRECAGVVAGASVAHSHTP